MLCARCQAIDREGPLWRTFVDPFAPVKERQSAYDRLTTLYHPSNGGSAEDLQELEQAKDFTYTDIEAAIASGFRAQQDHEEMTRQRNREEAAQRKQRAKDSHQADLNLKKARRESNKAMRELNDVRRNLPQFQAAAAAPRNPPQPQDPLQDVPELQAFRQAHDEVDPLDEDEDDKKTRVKTLLVAQRKLESDFESALSRLMHRLSRRIKNSVENGFDADQGDIFLLLHDTMDKHRECYSAFLELRQELTQMDAWATIRDHEKSIRAEYRDYKYSQNQWELRISLKNTIAKAIDIMKNTWDSQNPDTSIEMGHGGERVVIRALSRAFLLQTTLRYFPWPKINTKRYSRGFLLQWYQRIRELQAAMPLISELFPYRTSPQGKNKDDISEPQRKQIDAWARDAKDTLFR